MVYIFKKEHILMIYIFPFSTKDIFYYQIFSTSKTNNFKLFLINNPQNIYNSYCPLFLTFNV